MSTASWCGSVCPLSLWLSSNIQRFLPNCPLFKLVFYQGPTTSTSGRSNGSGMKYSEAFVSLSPLIRFGNTLVTFEDDFLAVQVLLEALGHGFIRIQQLALMVFDEGTLWIIISNGKCLRANNLLSPLVHWQSPIKHDIA